ncbi:hypothetical protein BU23DRAFT_551264 [Bimuria novae-zelandiae CBS 107.79]|uniref:Tat pathway signal sequence n=1 Tax=Bimuria novae-zelandiae CBS 107.79 TaxID=1447943 RepID=A0A6A5VPK7_9PLEO|nr:hypothetical protein BU23DRAFT_551264 [Bimuria novae-zelandiae CBS 107.79]
MIKYTAIPSKENDSVTSLSPDGIVSTSGNIGHSGTVYLRFAKNWWPWILHLFVLSVSVSAGFLVQSESKCSSTKDELLGDHPWDRTVRFDGSLSRGSSHYKGPPSTEVDELWEQLVPHDETERVMVISEGVFQTVNTSKHSVKAPSNLGPGRLAAFEGFHYIHCLHNLWKTHYPEYYTEEANFAKERPEEWLEHVDHCVDMLRQKLMCDADPGLITYSWLKNHHNPHPNFNVEHKCRSYDKLLEASARYGVDLGDLLDEGIRRPDGETVVDFIEPPFDPLAEV